MNLKLKKQEIKEKIDQTDDERALWAIARILRLDEPESPEWHKQVVEDRFEEYERNPKGAIGWEEIKKKWKNEL